MVSKNILLSSGFWVLNKDLIKLVGIDASILLSTFAEAEELLADELGWFYQTLGTVEEMTTLSRHKQEKAIKLLEEKGIIEKELRHTPPKRFFKINHTNLSKHFEDMQKQKAKKKKEVLEEYKQKAEKVEPKKESTEKPKKAPTEPVSLLDKINSKSEAWTEALKVFETNGFGFLSPHIVGRLVSLSEEFTDQWLLDALKISADMNKRNLGYVEGILKRWTTEGKNSGKKLPKHKEKESKEWSKEFDKIKEITKECKPSLLERVKEAEQVREGNF